MRTRKILLVGPPFYRLIKDTYGLCRYPLSLGYLCSAVQKNTDWEARVFNADFLPAPDPFEVAHLVGEGFLAYRRNLRDPSHPAWREVRECIAEYGPSVVGVTAMSSTFGSAQMVARIAKEVDPGILVIAGGPHPSCVGTEVLGCPHIDIGVCGEGERTLPELLGALQAGTRDALDGVPGIAYRKNGQAVFTPRPEPIEELDSLGFPALSAPGVLIDYHRYPVDGFRSVLATRGCPNNCFYCGSRNVWGRSVRFRSPENVAGEIRTLQEMGVGSIHFEDDTFGVNSGYLQALCRAIGEHCPGVAWSCETHVKMITDENVSIMKNAGCTMIQLGIESGSNDILRAIRKGFTIEEALKACEIVQRHGIALEAFFMAGLPRETEQTLRATLGAIEKIECRKVIYSIFNPYPGTEAFEWCRARGLIGNDHDPSLHHHHSPANRFCMALDHDLFRSIASQLERLVDEKNRLARGEPGKEAADGANPQAHSRLHP
jgi:anaerobic magnesium-protoporphyrin IX monomethyl ester cyclase